MKKLLGLATLVLLFVALVGCGGTTTEDTNNTNGTTTAQEGTTTGLIPQTLTVQFVPSTTIDTNNLNLMADLQSLLEEYLQSYGYDINVNIGVGTSYPSVIQGMVSGQINVGFLTAQQYAYTTLAFPGKVNVLLTAVRNGYTIQLDDNGNEITDTSILVQKANAAGYDASTTSDLKVSSYYSMLLVRAEDYAQYQNDGIKALAGKTVAVQSKTSGSGYVYPSYLLYQNDMQFVDDNPNAANGDVKAVTYEGHTNGVNAVLNGDVDAAFVFFDARYITSAYAAWQTANPDKNIYTYTKVVALSDPIYNDTISCMTALDQGLQTAIQNSFISIIQSLRGAKDLAIYNHTGYKVAKDSDYDSERGLYQFLNPTT